MKQINLYLNNIKNTLPEYFYINLKKSLNFLYKVDKKACIRDIIFIDKNIDLFVFLYNIIHIEMIFSFLPIKINGKYTILYKDLYYIYLENKKYIDSIGINFFSEGGRRFNLYNSFIDNKFNKKLGVRLSFIPKHITKGLSFEDGEGSFTLDFIITNETINKGIGEIYDKKIYILYSFSFYISSNNILISSMQGRFKYKFPYFKYFFYFIQLLMKKKSIKKIIGLSNNNHFCKHHKNFKGDYDNIFKKYGFILNKKGYYETNSLKIKKIDFNFNEVLGIFY